MKCHVVNGISSARLATTGLAVGKRKQKQKRDNLYVKKMTTYNPTAIPVVLSMTGVAV